MAWVQCASILPMVNLCPFVPFSVISRVLIAPGCGTTLIPKCCHPPNNETDLTLPCPAGHYPCGTQSNGVPKCCIKIETSQAPQEKSLRPEGRYLCLKRNGEYRFCYGQEAEVSKRQLPQEKSPCRDGDSYPCIKRNGQYACCIFNDLEISKRELDASLLCPPDYYHCGGPYSNVCCPIDLPLSSSSPVNKQCDDSTASKGCVCIKGNEVCPVGASVSNREVSSSSCRAGSEICGHRPSDSSPMCCRLPPPITPPLLGPQPCTSSSVGTNCECIQGKEVCPKGGEVSKRQLFSSCPSGTTECGTDGGGGPACCPLPDGQPPCGAVPVEEGCTCKDGVKVCKREGNGGYCGTTPIPPLCSCNNEVIIC